MTKQIPTIRFWTFLRWLPGLVFNPLPTLLKITEKYGDIIQFSVSKTQQLILVNHPDYIRHILKENPQNYGRKKAIFPMAPYFGDGLFMSEGGLWEQQHLMIKPTFHDEQIKSYYACIQHETELFIEDWKSKSKQGLIDIEFDINVLMLKILVKTQFSSYESIDFKGIITDLRIILDSTSFYKQKISYSLQKVTKYTGISFAHDQRALMALARLKDTINHVRKHARSNPQEAGFLLNLLENAREDQVINDQQVIDEIMNFFIAGFDTTASALTWTLYATAMNDAVQQKLHQELRMNIKNEEATGESLSQLHTIKMVVSEAMRLYPPVWSFHRVSEEDDLINDYRIPKDTHIMMSPWTLHRHPQLWDQPHVFNLERFNSKAAQGKAFTYIPFGQGKRMCIGKPLAIAELHLIFAMLMKEFRFEYPFKKEAEILPGIIIKAKRPLLMKLQPISTQT